MYRVTADGLQTYLDFDPLRKVDLLKLHELIREAALSLRERLLVSLECE
jgi:hypothetical protein